MTLLHRTAAGVAAALLLSACAADRPDDGGDAAGTEPTMEVDVAVDTPGLRKIKQRAGIEDCPAAPAGRPPAEDPLPAVTLPCLGGGPAVDLSGLRGPAVINLWAQWCGPCRDELPYYQRLHETGEVDVLGVDWLDPQPAGALELAEETGVTYPLLADPAGVLRPEFRIRGLPGAVFVDAEGRVVAVEFVVVRSYDELAALVEKHLGVDV